MDQKYRDLFGISAEETVNNPLVLYPDFDWDQELNYRHKHRKYFEAAAGSLGPPIAVDLFSSVGVFSSPVLTLSTFFVSFALGALFYKEAQDREKNPDCLQLIYSTDTELVVINKNPAEELGPDTSRFVFNRHDVALWRIPAPAPSDKAPGRLVLKKLTLSGSGHKIEIGQYASPDELPEIEEMLKKRIEQLKNQNDRAEQPFPDENHNGPALPA